MANKTYNSTIKFTGQFDTSQITKGLQDIKKQVTNANISEDLKKQFETAFNKLQVNIPALEKLTSKEDFNLKDIQALQKLLKEVTKDWENLNKITDQIDLSKTFSTKDLEKIKNIDKQIKQTQDNIQKARKELVDSFSKENSSINTSGKNISSALTELFTVKPNEIDSKFKEIQSQFTEGIQKTQNELRNKLEGANIQKSGGQLLEYFFGKDSGVEFVGKIGPIRDEINAIIRDYRKFKDASDEAGMVEQVEKLNKVLTNAANFKVPEGNSLFGLPTKEDLSTWNQIGEVLDKIKKAAEGKEVFFTEQEIQLAEQFKQKVEAENEAAKNANNSHQQFNNTLQQTGQKFQDTGKKVDDLADQFNKIKAQNDALSATFGSLANRITSSISALTVFNKSIQVVHKAIASVKDLDAAFTQIAIVSEQTNEQAWQMFDSFNKLAKQYSITTKDLTEGAKLFYQQGLSAADTMKMVEASTISAALGEVSMTEAANTLTAAIQGYNESAAVAMDYTDKIAMVGAVSAADFNELSAAMEKTASSAYTAGLDFDNLLGYLGKMIEVTREAPANLGTAMKTIIARFEDMKKNPMAILEDGVSANKVEDALASIGVALRDTVGEFRPLQDVFLDLGMKWDSLSRNQQAYIATVAAGSRQQSRFLAIFNNFDRTLELITESQNSAGAAARQYATYQDSAAAATARLTAAWEEFYSKVVSSDMIKDAINGLTKLVEIMSAIGPKWTAAVGVITAHSINKAIKSNIGGKILNSLISTELIDGKNKVTATISSIFVTGIKEGIAKSRGNFPLLGKTIQDTLATSASKGLSTGILSGIASIGSALGAALPIIAGIVAGVAAISLAVWGIHKAIKASNEENEKFLKAQSEKAKEVTEELQNKTKEKRIIQDNYEIYKKYENRVVLTKEELEEQNKAVDAIKEQYKDLVVVTDELGKKNIINTIQLETHTEELKTQIKEEKELIALAKLRATQPTGISEKKYGVNNNKYMHDWTEEQLMNVGYSQYEAQILNTYGEIYGNKDKTKATYFDFGKSLIGEELDKDSLFNMISNDMSKLGYNINYFNYDFQEAFDTFFNMDEEALQNFADGINVVKQEDKELDALQQIFQKYAQIMIEGKNILEKSNKEYADSVARANLEVEDAILNNDINELLNNVNNYTEDFFDTENKENDKEIEQEVKEWATKLSESLNKLDETDKKEVHDFIKNLLDPTLSETARQDIIKKFKSQYDYLEDEFDEIIKAYEHGTEQEKAQRQKMEENFGLEEGKLNNYNFQELNLLDQLYTNSKAENKKEIFGDSVLQEATEDYIKALSNFKQDVIENPAIYGPVHDATIEMWEKVFEIDKEDAQILFEKMYGTFPEIALQSAKEGFGKAKDLLNTDSKSSLSDEDYNNLTNTYGEELNYYIKINDEGEKYLTLAGKISILERERNNLAQAYLGKIEENNIKIREARDLIQKEGKENNEVKKAQEKQIAILEQQNELYGQQLDKLEDINALAKDAATATNISLAEDYYNDLDVIKKAEKEILASNGRISLATRKAFLAMGSTYSQYIDTRMTGEGAIYEITAENLENIKNARRKSYEQQVAEEKDLLQKHITTLEGELEYFKAVAEGEVIVGESRAEGQKTISEDEYNNRVKDLDNTLLAYEEEAEDELTEQDQKQKQASQGVYNYATNYQNMMGTAIDNVGAKWTALMNAMANSSTYDSTTAQREITNSLEDVKTTIDNGADGIKESGDNLQDAEEDALKPPETPEDYQNHAKIQVQRIQDAIDEMRARLDELNVLAPDIELPTGSGKGDTDKTVKELEAITDAIKELTDALEELNELSKEVEQNLNDIDIDISPFTDLFEEWEHEWDYFYNIKTLISNIGRSRNMFSQISSAEWASPEQRIQADEAYLGATFADASARKKYAEGLYSAIIQKGTDMTEKYGQFGRFDPDTMTWYQRDDELIKLNEEQEKHVKEINRLQEEQWKKNNELETQNAVLEALEQQRDAHEDILNTLQDQHDSLVDNENIQADVSGLEAQIAAEKQIIDGIDKEIDAQKTLIKTIQDQLKDLDFDLWKEQDTYDFWDQFVSDMEDDIGNINDMMGEYYDNVDEIMEDANAYWEMYTSYIEAAIDTQQELYDAIVENYQKEINEKKRQYNYLKQLDNEYLQSVKDNIEEERRARDDSNKQKSYQQNIQRAQLLQMDTSGAYRTELASLKKDIESQRQELYDDLVDKQVEALEKEIEKRHELYDKEVAALEERLAYMQENAILLWDMVNGIIAQGSEAMMQTLENTTDYINSNELKKEQQRRVWEDKVKKSVKVATDDTVQKWGAIAKVLGEIATQTYPNFKKETDEFSGVLDKAEKAVGNYADAIQRGIDSLDDVMPKMVASLSTAMDNYTKGWAAATSLLTGNVTEYGQVVKNMISSTSTNIQTLNNWNSGLSTSGDRIIKTIDTYNEKLADKYAEIYQTYKEERQKHKDELEDIIKKIGDEISAAVRDAGDAIRRAAESIQVSTPQQTSNSNGSGGPTGSGDTEPTGPGGGEPKGTEQHFRAEINSTARDSYTGRTKKVPGTLSGYTSREAAKSAAEEYIRRQEQALRDEIEEDFRKKNKEHLIPNIQITSQGGFGIYPYKQGGLASFTGLAWLDGTKSNPERVLSPKQTKLFDSMVSSLERVSLNNSNINSALGSSYNIGDINTNINVEKLDNETDINKVARQVEDKIMKSIRNRISIAIA